MSDTVVVKLFFLSLSLFVCFQYQINEIRLTQKSNANQSDLVFCVFPFLFAYFDVLVLVVMNSFALVSSTSTCKEGGRSAMNYIWVRSSRLTRRRS